MTDWFDNEIRRHFRLLQQDDVNHTPPFARSWDEATSLATESARCCRWKVRYGSLAFASLMVAFTVLTLLQMRTNDAPPEPDLLAIRHVTSEWSSSIDDQFAIASLSQWLSPTHFLLERHSKVILHQDPMSQKPM